MATAPSFFDKCCNARARLTTGETDFTGAGANTVTPTWTGTSGGAPPATDWLLKRIRIIGNGNVADSVVNVWVTDAAGANPRLNDSIDLGDPVATSTTVSGTVFDIAYGADFTFAASQDLRFAVTVTPTSGSIDVVAYCERA